MAQLERLSKSSENSRSPRCQTPKAFEQPLQRDVLSRNYDHDHEDNNKKSVLKKVKEKAKKLKRSLSGKKKHGMETNDDNTAPSSDTKWEDATEDDENPEFLGAPMYESELAPETLKENSRQYPKANSVVPGNHDLHSCLKTEVKQGKDKSIDPNKTTTQSDSDQLAPKIEGLTITNANEQETKSRNSGTHVAVASAATGTGYVSGRFNDERLKNLERKSETREHSHNRSQQSDKGVSMKEYFIHKLEPGEDEKALSQVISESFSPKESTGKGVVDKVKEAISSFIWHEEESQPTIKTTNQSSSTASDARKLQSIEANFATSPVSSSRNAVCNRSNPSPFLPVPSNTSDEVAEEQNHGRILQTN